MGNIPNYLSLPISYHGTKIATIHKVAAIRGFSGETIASIVSYHIGNKLVCLHANNTKGELALGKFARGGYLLDQDVLEKYKSAPIIFFQDPTVAMELRTLLGVSTNKEPEFIISTHVSKNLSLVPWNFLHGHDVTFVPKPTGECLALVRCYAEYCKDSRIGNFKITNKFFIHGKIPLFEEIEKNKFSAAERFIFDNCIGLGDVKYPHVLLRNLINMAVPFQEFEKLWQRLGVFKGGEPIQLDTKTCVSSSVPPEMKPARAQTLEEVTITHILRSGSPVMLVGMKNAGKTQSSYLFARGFLGKPNLTWPFNTNKNPTETGNVCIVDAETPDDLLMENLSQHDLAGDLGKRLFVFSDMHDGNPDWYEKYTINDEEYRAELFKFLVNQNCRLLILDNMKALMGSKVAHPDSVQKVFDWMKQLCKAGLCVLYILHKDEEAPGTSRDKNKGASTFREMAHCIANLFGKNEIVDSEECPEKVKELARKGGLTFGLHFSTCKSAPVLEGIRLWMHIPFGSGELPSVCVTDAISNDELDMPQIDLGNGTSAVNVDGTEAVGPADAQASRILSGLSSGAQEVYAQIKALPGGECRIGELEQKFAGIKGMSLDSIRDKYLDELIKAKLVEKIGENARATKYRVIQP